MPPKAPPTDPHQQAVDRQVLAAIRFVSWYVVWVGGYAVFAYAINQRVASVVFVLLAGFAWPVGRWFRSLFD